MELPSKVAFTIPGTSIDIYWYAVLITSGIILAVFVASYYAKKRNMPKDTAIDLCLWAVPVGLICARLYYVLFTLSEYHSFIDVINIRNGGLAIPGGIIGGVLGVFIYSRIKKKNMLGYLDIMVPGVALAQAIGRWGNFFNQEAFGIGVTKGLYFPFAVKIDEANDIGCKLAEQGIQHGHLATFFYESMFCLAIFVVLFFVSRKQKHKGDMLLTYLMMYCFERAILETFRTDALTGIFGTGVRVTQVLCIVILVLCIAYIVFRTVYEKKTSKLLMPLSADDYSDAPEAAKTEQAEETKQNNIETEQEVPEAPVVKAEEDKDAKYGNEK